jgi:hypothetical protein
MNGGLITLWGVYWTANILTKTFPEDRRGSAFGKGGDREQISLFAKCNNIAFIGFSK